MSSVNEFTWTKKHERAAVLLAEDELTDVEIAGTVGVSPASLARWKRNQEFAGRVADTVGQLRASALQFAIAKRHRRIEKLQRLVDRIEQTIEDRAHRATTDPNAPAEARTGLLAERHIMVAGGHSVTDWQTDDKLIREYRAVLDQAAKDLGQLTERVEVQQETLIRRYVGVNVDEV